MEVKIGKRKPAYHGMVSKTKLNALIVKHLKSCGIESKCITLVKKSDFIDKLWNDLEGNMKGGAKKERKPSAMTPARKAHIEKMKLRGKMIAKIMKETGKKLGEASKMVSTYQEQGGKKVSKKPSKKVSKKQSKKVSKKPSKKVSKKPSKKVNKKKSKK
jgi:hypothetical protein